MPLLLGVWGTILYKRFTPLYAPVKCKMGGIKVQDVKFRPTLTFGVQVTLTCANPNHFSVKLENSRRGKVWVGPDHLEGGLALELPPTVVPANGTGSVGLLVRVIMKETTPIFRKLSMFLGGQFQLKFELLLDLTIGVRLFFGRVAPPAIAFDKDCGLKIVGLLGFMRNPKNMRIGQIACANTFEELDLPNVTDAKGLPGEIKPIILAKNITLGVMMSIGYVFFLLLLCCTICCLCRKMRQLRRENNPTKVDDDTINI